MIASEGTADSLPVSTLADPDRFAVDRAYRDSAAVRLMDRIIDIELVRGSGRLYIP